MDKALELIRTLIDGANEYEKKTGNTNPTVYLSRNNLLVIKQALIKAQEPKKYLKWEDLEFNRNEAEYMKVSLNGTKYCLMLTWGFCEPKMVKVKPINLYEEEETEGQTIFLLDGNYINDRQFFNDLHLERVEE